MDGEGPIKDERTKLLQKEACSNSGGGVQEAESQEKCCCSILKAGMEQCWSALVYGDPSDGDSTKYLGPESSSSGNGSAPLAYPEDENCPSPHKVARYDSIVTRDPTQRQSSTNKSHFKPFLPSCLGERADGKGCGLFAGCDSRFSHSHEQSSYTMAGGDTGATEDISPASDSSSPVKDTFPYTGNGQKPGGDLKVHNKDHSGGSKGSGRTALEESGVILEGEEHYRLPPCCPDPNEPTLPELVDFDNTVCDFMRDQGIPGASLVLAKDGKVIYTQTFGWAKHGVRVKPHHLFRIASVSKIFTATAIMKLVEEKRISLNDKAFGPKGLLSQYSPPARGLLSQYSPPARGDRRLLRINIRHLLQHSAGWDREEVGDPVFWRHIGTEMGVHDPVDQHTLIAYMMTQKLQFTPGMRHAYSNLGYEVLGRVIEKVSGQSYADYMQGLLHSIGISRMRLGKTPKSEAHQDEVEYFASPRVGFVDSIFPGHGRVPSPYGGFALEYGDADGGWIATATDLITFLHALDGTGPKSIIRKETFKQMLARPSYAKGSAWYGLGLDVTWYGKSWEHGGTLDGATSCLVQDRNGYSWSFVANYWPPDSDYTSLISYALSKVKDWCSVKKIDIEYGDAMTLNRKYVINVKLPHGVYENYHNIFTSLGYRPYWINGYQVKTDTFLNVIWIKDKQDYVSHHALSESELTSWLNRYPVVGYRPCHIDSYLLGTEVMYAVIFLKQCEPPWRLHHSLPVEQLQAKTSKLKEQGYIITRQSVTRVSGIHQVAALYEKQDSGGNWSKVGLSSEAYLAEFARHTRHGHLLAYVKAYEDGDTTSFSTIWTNPGPYHYTSEVDMSSYRLLNDFLFAAEKKFNPLCISGYEDEGAHKFVAVCFKKVPAKSK